MSVNIMVGDCRDHLRGMPDASVHCCVTSPPYYGLRDYGVGGQIGLEPSPEAFVAEMVGVFREVRRVLRDDGTLWLNLGDSYASAWACNRRNVVGSGSLENGKRDAMPNRLVGGLKEKDLIGIPWRVAFALQADGWYLRQDIIWHKPNPMPESVRDRCTKAHEYVFLLAKSERYFYDAVAIAEAAAGPAGGNTKPNKSFVHDPIKHRTKAGLAAAQAKAREAGGFKIRNRRSVWSVTSEPFSGAHFATFPSSLIEPMILAGCPKGGTVLDPFSGAGTTGVVADRLGRNATLIELNPIYAEMAQNRILGGSPLFAEVALWQTT